MREAEPRIHPPTSRASRREGVLRLAALLPWGLLPLLLLAHSAAADPPSLERVEPSRQRVHGILTLEGSGFGDFVPGQSRVVIGRPGSPPGQGTPLFDAGAPYVWRDDFIQIRVPVGTSTPSGPRPMPRGRLAVRVVQGEDSSTARFFRVVEAPPGRSLAFRQLTELSGAFDVSTVLGAPSFNLERTKDAEVGDIDGDGWPDLVDSNSFNFFAAAPGVVRTNDRRGGFVATPLEPTAPGATGSFATVIPPGGSFIGNGIIYDADLVDLNNDTYPELVQAVAYLDRAPMLRVLEHRGTADDGELFVEETAAWLPLPAFAGSPDDLDHRDIDHDGFVDLAVALRNTPRVEVLPNEEGETFAPSILLDGTGGSAHDVFFLDADSDGWWDLFLVDELGPSQLFVNEGPAGTPGYSSGSPFEYSAYQTGASADLDGDGREDFVLAGSYGAGLPQSRTEVFLADPEAPGSFRRSLLPATGPGIVYDLELGDLDLDGDVDMVGAVLLLTDFDGDDAIVVWLNQGDGSFIEATAGGAGQLLPGSGPYQRLSVELFDLDLDGDLDLYATGADLQFLGFGLGNAPNQLWENLLLHRGPPTGAGSTTERR